MKFGLKNKEVKLEKYNNRYPELYLKEKKHLEKLLNGLVINIEHIGSTAIPGIFSKPCIDVMIGIESMRKSKKVLTVLINSGYEWKEKFNRPGQHILLVNGGALRTHYIHVVRNKGKIWKDRIFFRDYIQNHKKAFNEYQKLKEISVKKFPTSRTGYTDEKTKFVRKIVELRKLK
jgi:GrpB-like predicted nucleotidyltransferase (UPF0157 family)